MVENLQDQTDVVTKPEVKQEVKNSYVPSNVKFDDEGAPIPTQEENDAAANDYLDKALQNGDDKQGEKFDYEQTTKDILESIANKDWQKVSELAGKSIKDDPNEWSKTRLGEAISDRVPFIENALTLKGIKFTEEEKINTWIEDHNWGMIKDNADKKLQQK